MKTYITVQFDDQKIGDGFQIRPILVTNAGTGAAIDISDVQIVATFRMNRPGGKVLHTATNAAGITMGPESNKFTIDPWLLNVPECVIFCDVTFTFPGEMPRTYMQITLKVVSNTNVQ